MLSIYMTLKIEAIVTQDKSKSLEARDLDSAFNSVPSEAVFVCSNFFLHKPNIIKKEIHMLKFFQRLIIKMAGIKLSLRTDSFDEKL